MLRALTLTILMIPFIASVPDQARAQTASSAILTVDQDRLFTASAFGQRSLRDNESRALALSQENRGIEAGLIAEERELTEQRSALPPEEFRALADAFDDKVQRIRAEQDAKVAAVGRLREEDRQQFLGLIGPVLQGLVVERGALMLLDRRVVILSADSIDITDAAIAQIDRDIGDGAAAPNGGNPDPEAVAPDAGAPAPEAPSVTDPTPPPDAPEEVPVDAPAGAAIDLDTPADDDDAPSE